MKNAKQIHGGGIYVIQAECTANTHFIENKDEAKIFLNQLDDRIRHYMEVLEYNLMPNGWQILVRIKSEKSIFKYYQQKLQRRDIPPKKSFVTVSQVISEEIRILRSRFTNITNPRRGRQGNASKRVYQKYIFESVEAARKFIGKTRDGQNTLKAQSQRYQADRKHFDEDGQLKKSKEILTSKAFQDKSNSALKYSLGFLRVYDYLSDELEKWIRMTCDFHEIKYKRGNGMVLLGKKQSLFH